MRRTNISLTEEQYEKLKKDAYSLGISMSGRIRRLIDEEPSKISEVPEKKPQKSRMEKVSDEMYPEIVEPPKEQFNVRKAEKEITKEVGSDIFIPSPKPKKK